MKSKITTVLVLFVGIVVSNGHAETAYANGINWTYAISSGGDFAFIYGTDNNVINPDTGLHEHKYVPAIPSWTSGAVVVPSKLGGKPVTRIDTYSFFRCDKISSVQIPDTVTSISSSAFSGCTNLTSVVLPKSLRTIGENAALLQIVDTSLLGVAATRPNTALALLGRARPAGHPAARIAA